MLSISLLVTLVSGLSLTQAANPPVSPSPSTRPSRPLSSTQDCNGPVVFSGTGGTQHPSRLVGYRTTQAEAGVGWNAETGEFTVHCAGLYQLAFSGMTEPGAKLVLKKHSAASNSSDWTPIISTPKGGGSNVVILNLVVSDQVAVWTEGTGSLLTDQETDVHVISFSGFRISKNNKVELKS
uniref:C1q domain-containing protein n=1 Tax=Cacopsylla melanoneura TaxID=428564 RepID=A0A8D8T2Y2_9HEMI